MKPTKLVLLTGVLCAALSAGYLASQAKDNKAEVALHAATKTETVDGDLRGAIEQYKKIAALPGAGRATVATALLRMGQCHEKLGDADLREARKAYEQVVREYGDQAAVAAEARAKLAALAGASTSPGGSTLVVRRVWKGLGHKVSADGRFISFTDMGSNLAIHDLATGQDRRLTEEGSLNGPEECGEYSVPSPDSKSVAYTWWGATYDLRVVGLDGSKPRTLRAAGDGVLQIIPLAWSPDGKHLLAEFAKADGTHDMMLVAVADGSAKLLKATGKELSPGGVFSPDGRYIAWSTMEGISLVELQTGTESPLIPDRSNHSVLGWAPDGKHILFSSERSGSADAWLVAVAGGKAQGEPMFVKKDWGFEPMGFTSSGAFYYAANNNVFDVKIAELDPAAGGEARQLVRVDEEEVPFWGTPSWTPDGRYVAFLKGVKGEAQISYKERQWQLWRVAAEGGEPQSLGLTFTGQLTGALRLHPDGRRVAIDDIKENLEVWVMENFLPPLKVAK